MDGECDILRDARNGNQKAFKKLFNLHADVLFRFLSQFSDERAVAQDWTQRAFIKAFERIHQFSGQSSFRTWIFTIGLNEMRYDLRAKWQFESYNDQLHTDECEDFFSPEDWMSVRIAIRRLPPNEKMVVLLREGEGYSHKEIGEMLSIKESHSRVILCRAREKLKQWMNE